MKWIVFSDSHGSARNMETAVRTHYDTAAGFLFLGDGIREFLALRESYPDRLFAAVRGNCDPGSSEPTELTLTLDGYRVFLTHGHTCGVKYGTDALHAVASRTKADVILYGHTHERDSQFFPPDSLYPSSKPFYIFCPGSISHPRFGTPSYGILETLPAGILLNHAKP